MLNPPELHQKFHVGDELLRHSDPVIQQQTADLLYSIAEQMFLHRLYGQPLALELDVETIWACYQRLMITIEPGMAGRLLAVLYYTDLISPEIEAEALAKDGLEDAATILYAIRAGGELLLAEAFFLRLEHEAVGSAA